MQECSSRQTIPFETVVLDILKASSCQVWQFSIFFSIFSIFSIFLKNIFIYKNRCIQYLDNKSIKDNDQKFVYYQQLLKYLPSFPDVHSLSSHSCSIDNLHSIHSSLIRGWNLSWRHSTRTLCVALDSLYRQMHEWGTVQVHFLVCSSSRIANWFLLVYSTSSLVRIVQHVCCC